MADAQVEPLEQLFPKLTQAQIARIAAHAPRRAVPAGQIIFEQGQENLGVHVVLSGALEIVVPGIRGEEVVTVHGPGNFSGDVNVLAGRRAIVRGRMREAGELLDITKDCLQRIVREDPELSDVFIRAFVLRRVALMARGAGEATLLGSRHSAGTLRLQEFLSRNGQPCTYVDVDLDPDVQALLDRFGVGVGDVPVIICRGERVLKNPTNEEVAECFGLTAPLNPEQVRDVVVVGAGPAGLAAAVYAASEGLDVLVLETEAPGGQAGTSMKIENYLGFPEGISGPELSARAITQAQKFGAEIAVARSAVRFACDTKQGYEIGLANGSSVHARAMIIASGVQYRQLALPDVARFEGAGIYHAATKLEANLCAGEEVVVVGGANSAGQAAVFLSSEARHVHMLIRGAGLSETMSRYLIRRIEDNPRITLYPYTEIVGLEGRTALEVVRWRGRGGDTVERQVCHVFLMTGAEPHTQWLEGCVALDSHGFVKTGVDLTADDLAKSRWPLARGPLLLETSRPRVFAVGDVRSGSVKRVASAVGEGSICVQLVHRTLAE
jgi:thioredoxin reductase (NADPH)